MSLLSGANISAGFSIVPLGFNLPVGGTIFLTVLLCLILLGDSFLNESPFWGRSSCRVSDLSFQILVLLFGFCIPVGGHFS